MSDMRVGVGVTAPPGGSRDKERPAPFTWFNSFDLTGLEFLRLEIKGVPLLF